MMIYWVILIGVVEVRGLLVSETCQKIIQEQLNISFPIRNQGLAGVKNITTIKNIQPLIHQNCIMRIPPHYKWSQNTTHIQVLIQLKASAQTTPCEYLIYQNQTVNYDGFIVDILCLHSQTYLINYYLKVKTFKSINYHYSDWQITPQKYIILQALKAPAPYIWKYLHSETTVPERKPKVWWEMLIKYKDNMGDMVDKMDIGEIDVDISTKIRQAPKKSKQTFDHAQQIQYYCYQGSPEYLGSWL